MPSFLMRQFKARGVMPSWLATSFWIHRFPSKALKIMSLLIYFSKFMGSLDFFFSAIYPLITIS
jgi:hypothetical protein